MTQIRKIKTEDIPILRRLLQFYYYDSTLWSREQISADGTFEGPDDLELLSYATHLDECGYLVYEQESLAGFALIAKDECAGYSGWEISDIFVLPSHRRTGVASAVFDCLLQEYKGTWLISVLQGDFGAEAFWRATLFRRESVVVIKEEVECDYTTFVVAYH
jgi:predicted acetyltransferase